MAISRNHVYDLSIVFPETHSHRQICRYSRWDSASSMFNNAFDTFDILIISWANA